MNPNDEIRNKMLRYFYDRNLRATSRTGKKGSAVKISDVKKELKALHGLSQQQVVSNLTYLLDRGWVKENSVSKQVATAGGTVIPSTVKWYEIAAPGIDKMEGESEFKPKERYAGINIQATGQNVITLGDGNVVNANYQQLHAEIDRLKTAVSESDLLPEQDKLNAAADIESIKDQLAKPTPNAAVIRQLWSGIERIVVAVEFSDIVQRVAQLLQPLF